MPKSKKPPAIKIRPATKRDIPAIVSLIRGLAKYERLAAHCHPSPTRLRQHGFGPQRYFETQVCTRASRPIGFALYYFAYSTFTSSPVLFIEDIFVLPTERSKGAGTALMKSLARVAVRKGCRQMGWHVLDWNKPAIRLYRRLGARLDRSWVLTRLTDANLRRLARSSRIYQPR